MKAYSSNIGKNYLFTFFSNINFTHGLWLIFLALRGFSLTEIALLESIFHISSLIFEVPSGAIADIFGRKYCRISGRFLFIISLFIMYYAGTFILQAVGFMLTAFSYNLESGAGEAFVYDSMKLDGNESKYIHTAGRIELFYQLATIISFFVGGFLATGPGYIYVFYLSALFSLAALITGLGFREPEITEHKEQEHRSMFKVLRDSAVILKSRPKIIYLIVFTETIFVFSTSLFFYLQNFLKISGRTEFYIGTFYSISAVFCCSFSLLRRKDRSEDWREKRHALPPASAGVYHVGSLSDGLQGIFLRFNRAYRGHTDSGRFQLYQQAYSL